MASGNDIRAAQETYSSFIVYFKWGAIVAAIITAGVVALIAS